MPSYLYTAMMLRHILFISVICHYVSKSNSLQLIDEIKSGLDKLRASKNIVLPKDYVFTADEESSNTDLYSAGLKNEDIYLNGTQLIQKYGYKVEEHHVVTSDGYDLGLYRIPGKGRVVFLMHGLLCSFVDWLTAGPDQGLAYLLASKGYDVWMGNARGNTYSRKNINTSPSDVEFWDFSFYEIGTNDLPAMIDYVLAKTGKEKLTYVGHSQGTTSFFVLCSTKPEYNDKIDLMIALSAVAWMEHVPNPILQIIAPDNAIVYATLKTLGVNEIAPDNNVKKALSQIFCGNSFLASVICANVAFLICGFDYSQINYNQLPVMLNHAPAGSSLKQFEHYAQLIVSGGFNNYDYGSTKNTQKYGTISPPPYQLDKINAPIAIFQSQGDWLASTTDVNYLRSKLPNVVDYNEVALASFNHMDYLWAKDVKKLVYDKLITLIKEN